jgi:glycosyltransferase involved in cell wall biosynthesis
MPREEQSVFLNACDVGLISLVEGMYGAAVPSRTYNFLAAGKPILSLLDDGSETACVVEEERAGWNVSSRDPQVLAQKVLDIVGQRAELQSMGERARRAAIAKYSTDVALDAYSEALS